MGVKDIMSRTYGAGHVNASSSMSGVQRSAKALNSGIKYEDRVQLQKSGTNKVYDDIHSGQLKLNNYNTTHTLAKNKLMQQALYMDRITELMNTFRMNTIDGSSRIKTKQETADGILDDLQKLLNASSVDGEYLFGGIRSDERPIKDDLTKNTNYVNGAAVKNYSDTSSNTNTVKVSDHHEIRVDLVHANLDSISNFIASLNIYKKSESSAEVSKMQDLFNLALKQQREIETKIGESLQKLNEAEQSNSINEEKFKVKTNEFFRTDVTSEAVQFRDHSSTIKASISTSAAVRKLTNQLLESL
jgi:hypothetical protein